MMTAMAASSLLRLLRPGPTTLSKSSWEFSPDDIWAAREKTDKFASYMETLKDVPWKYPLVFPLLRTLLPVAHSLSWIFLASHLWPLHLAPRDRRQHIACHLQKHASSLLMRIKSDIWAGFDTPKLSFTNKPSVAVRYPGHCFFGCCYHKPKPLLCMV